jgi:hypothetical protein
VFVHPEIHLCSFTVRPIPLRWRIVGVDSRRDSAQLYYRGRYTRRLRPFWDGERISSLRTLAIGARVGKAGSDLFRSPMKGALMRDFRDAKVMARA